MEKKEHEGKKQVFKSEREASEGLYGEEEVNCFDCGCEISADGEEIKNGTLLVYEDDGKEIFVFKCNDCFSKNEGIENYKECEVYSRIVGYLRPISQWNEGKRREYEERKEYVVNEE